MFLLPCEVSTDMHSSLEIGLRERLYQSARRRQSLDQIPAPCVHLWTFRLFLRQAWDRIGIMYTTMRCGVLLFSFTIALLAPEYAGAQATDAERLSQCDRDL